MPTLFVTQALGGKTRPIGMTTVGPSGETPVSELERLGGKPAISGLHLAELLSSFAAHERATVRLCLAAARQTWKEEWRSVYGGIVREHLAHLAILEDLIERLGGSPTYISPAARAADYQILKLMEVALIGGSLDTDARDVALLDSVVLAGAKCRDNREVLDRIARHLPPGRVQQMIEASVSQLQAEGDDYGKRAMEMRQATLVAGVVSMDP
jgi:hypothetical protein